MSSKPVSLSEKLNALLTGNQNIDSNAQDSEDENSRPQVVEFDIDEYQLPEEKTTEFQNKNVKLLSDQSARYRGKISSRHALSGSESEQVEESEKSDSDSNDSNASDYDDDEEENSDENVSRETESESDESNEDVQRDSKEEILNKANRQAEVLKGLSVQNQLRIWERLLEIRIQSQKLISKANQLPELQEWKSANKDIQLESIAGETKNYLCKLLQTYLQLQTTLTNQYPELNDQLKQVSDVDNADNDISTCPLPIKRFAMCLGTRHENIQQYRNDVLLKWEDRTRLLTRRAGANKRKAEESFDIIRKIENAALNRNGLIRKSQILKSGESSAEITDELIKSAESQMNSETLANPNIYDDSDFYYQQLRELIEYKANNTSTTAEVTKQYIELQKLRQKMKKKVDQRASKGRKLRYIVHNKLINFIAPNDDSCTWTDEAKDELYKSLFTS